MADNPLDPDYCSAVIDKMSDAYIVHDMQGRVRDVNTSLCTALGYSREELLSMTVFDVEMTAQRKDSGEWQRIYDQGLTFSTTGVHRYKSGETRPVELKVCSIEKDGEACIIAFCRDATHRLNAERHAQFTQFAVDNAGDAAFWVQAKYPRFIYVNKAAAVYLEYTQSELLAMSVYDINPSFTTDDWQEFVDHIEDIGYMVYESRHLSKSGQFVPVEVTAKYMEFDSHGYVVMFVRDITSRLEIRRRLEEEKRRAEDANRAKSQFLSAMSHELKTPLNAIMGYSEIILEEGESVTKDDLAHFIHSINHAGHLLRDLINDVLDLAKIESGQVNLDLREIKLAQVFSECHQLIAPIASKSGISLFDFPNDPMVEVVADFTRAKQVLINLLSNAIKYNKRPGEVRLSYDLLPESVRISVTDTGLGIPQEKQSEVFRSFNRLGRENSSIEGTGIGLVICKQLVESMGGEIGFESREGEGTCFWFTLPRCRINLD